MPRATIKYPFESKILEWACNFSSTMAKHPLSAFSIILNSEGIAQQIIFGDKTKSSLTLKKTPDEPNPSWLLFDPFDAPFYIYITWKNVERETIERLVGKKFEESDFISKKNEHIVFPTSWGVMY